MNDFLMAVAVVVVGGATLAGLGFAAKWLLVKDNRVAIRQRLCRHNWQRFPESHPGDAVIVIRTAEAEFLKCGARR